MNSDYSKALNGFHSQLNAFSTKKAEYGNKLLDYQDRLGSATQSAKALASSKIIGDGVKGIEGLGTYGARRATPLIVRGNDWRARQTERAKKECRRGAKRQKRRWRVE